MLNISKWNLFFVLSVCLIGLYFLIPNFYGKSEVTAITIISLLKKQVNLGLDLQGGSHLLLEVETKTVLKEESENFNGKRSFLRKSKIKYTNLGSKVTGAVVTVKDKEKVDFVKREIRQNINKDIIISSEKNKITFLFSEN